MRAPCPPPRPHPPWHEAQPGTGLGRAKDWMGPRDEDCTTASSQPSACPQAPGPCPSAPAAPRPLQGPGPDPAPPPPHSGPESPATLASAPLPFPSCSAHGGPPASSTPPPPAGEGPPFPAGMTTPDAQHRQAWTQTGVTSPAPACDLRSPGQRLPCCRPGHALPHRRLAIRARLSAHSLAGGAPGAPVQGEPSDSHLRGRESSLLPGTDGALQPGTRPSARPAPHSTGL